MARSSKQQAAQHSSAKMPGKTPLGATLLVLFSTLLIAAGQLIMKHGLDNSLFVVLIGVAMIGIAGLMVTYAFRVGELSALHALMGLGFLWATLASVFILGERLSILQIAGITIIMIGVGCITHSGRSA
jgi:drug/metabolite transporter (DMT)-like permease